MRVTAKKGGVLPLFGTEDGEGEQVVGVCPGKGVAHEYLVILTPRAMCGTRRRLCTRLVQSLPFFLGRLDL